MVGVDTRDILAFTEQRLDKKAHLYRQAREGLYGEVCSYGSGKVYREGMGGASEKNNNMVRLVERGFALWKDVSGRFGKVWDNKWLQRSAWLDW